MDIAAPCEADAPPSEAVAVAGEADTGVATDDIAGSSQDSAPTSEESPSKKRKHVELDPSSRAWSLRFAQHMTETQKWSKRRSWLQVRSWLPEIYGDVHEDVYWKWQPLAVRPKGTPGHKRKLTQIQLTQLVAVCGEPIVIQVCVCEGERQIGFPVGPHHTHCR